MSGSHPKTAKKRPPKLIPTLLRTKTGVLRIYYIRGRQRSQNHPQRATPTERRAYKKRARLARAAREATRGSAGDRPGGRGGIAPTADSRDAAAPPVERRRRRRREEGESADELIARVGGVRLRGAKYSTWFKAMGTSRGGTIADMRGAAESPDLLGGDLAGYAAPAAFYSNQSGILGAVKFAGVVSLGELIGRLNQALQFAGEEAPSFDFMTAYDSWEYSYQIVGEIGGETFVAYSDEGGA